MAFTGTSRVPFIFTLLYSIYSNIFLLYGHLKNACFIVWHRKAVAHLSDSKMPKDEGLRLLRVEMQRCLGSLKGKRQKIGQLHEELRLCRGRVNELQSQMDEAKLSAAVSTRPELVLGDSQSWDSDLNTRAHVYWQVKESSQIKVPEVSGESKKELLRLQEDQKRLQEQLEVCCVVFIMVMLLLTILLKIDHV